MTKPWLALLLVGACGPAATGPGAAAPSNQTTSPGRAAATPCPTGDALADAARRAWGKTGGVVTAECVAVIHDGETLWLFDGYFEPDRAEMMGMWTALATPAGDVRWADGDDELPFGVMLRNYANEHTAVDLDGDGNDEVLWVSGYDHGGYMGESLVAAGIADDGLVRDGDGVALSSDNTAAALDESETVSCTASWALVPAGAGHQIEVTYDAGCSTPGRKRYAWNGKALAEVPQ